MARRTSIAIALLTTALATSGGVAQAEDFEEFGFGARAQGMGGAMTALASDSTATYYNPGGLILSRHINLNLGFSFADYALKFDSAGGGPGDAAGERIPDLSALTLGRRPPPASAPSGSATASGTTGSTPWSRWPSSSPTG